MTFGQIYYTFTLSFCKVIYAICPRNKRKKNKKEATI
jgi:hypothetical protein